MNDLVSAEAAPTFVPPGRPVVRFVAVLAGVAALFAAVWWSGLYAPRMATTVSDRFDVATNTGVAVVTVRNQAPLTARVGPAELEPPVDLTYFEPPVRAVAVEPADEVSVEGGASIRITIHYALDCSGVGEAAASPRGIVTPSLRVRLPVTARLGTSRTVSAQEVVLGGACGEG